MLTCRRQAAALCGFNGFGVVQAAGPQRLPQQFVARKTQQPATGRIDLDNLIIGDIHQQNRFRRLLDQRAVTLLALTQRLLRFLFPGHVATAADSTDQLSIGIKERHLMNIQPQKLAPHIAELVKATRLPRCQHHLVRITADFAKRVPVGVLRMLGPLPRCKENIRLADRFIGVAGLQQHIADRLIGKQVAPLQILGPDQVRRIVAHAADQRIHVAV